MPVVTTHTSPAVARILDTLGLRGKNVKSLTITVNIDEVICAAVVMAMTQEQVDAVADLIVEVKPRPKVTLMDVTGLEAKVRNWHYDATQGVTS